VTVVVMLIVDVVIGVISVALSNHHQILRVILLSTKAVYHMILDVVVSFAVTVAMEVHAVFVMVTVLYVKGI
jgi:hypothetical protein